jgi:hypothetical protein
LAAAFRLDYSSNASDDRSTPNARPYFIGVFDTVASLSNTESLIVLCIAYAAIHIAVAAGLGLFSTDFAAMHEFKYWFWYWFGWIAVWAFCAAGLAYVYTHLKFAWRLPGFHFWDVIHLTDFRQKFYDQYLNPLVVYARHAISIDERRNDFRRVPWGASTQTLKPACIKLSHSSNFGSLATTPISAAATLKMSRACQTSL